VGRRKRSRHVQQDPAADRVPLRRERDRSRSGGALESESQLFSGAPSSAAQPADASSCWKICPPAGEHGFDSRTGNAHDASFRLAIPIEVVALAA